ncbi:MAG: ATP-binding cassette domain-containing protein [Gammaproteobacteria bacterium]|nr:ATP-binding cassette domain-containing protein [Gammaproteobacteria bacterium]
MSTVLEAVDLGKEVATAEGRFQIFSALNLQVAPGESLAVVGASGSGKSTLLGLLAGLDLPTSGHVELLDNNLSSMDEDGRARLRAGKVGFVFQSFHLIPTLTAIDNVMMPMELLSVENAYEKSVAALADVGLDRRQHHYPSQLSGGEQQRVALARAFVLQPGVLFADEPTGNLDHATGGKIADLLFDLVEQHNTAVVLATHDDSLSRRCDHVLELE